jgi:lipoprotein-anchoring transpeptidase ErfK/SrfK
MQTAGANGFRFAHRVVTGEIPRATRFVTGKVKRLLRLDSDGSFWYAEEVRGKPSILISLSEQMVYLFKDGQLAGGSPISSGSEGYDTRPGRYRIIEKDIDHLSSIYGDYIDSQGNILATNIDNRKDPSPPGANFDGAKMFYFMRIYNGVGMHQGYLPGYPASHGCIRLPAHMAEKFFHEVSVGTPVEIVP